MYRRRLTIGPTTGPMNTKEAGQGRLNGKRGNTKIWGAFCSAASSRSRAKEAHAQTAVVALPTPTQHSDGPTMTTAASANINHSTKQHLNCPTPPHLTSNHDNLNRCHFHFTYRIRATLCTTLCRDRIWHKVKAKVKVLRHELVYRPQATFGACKVW